MKSPEDRARDVCILIRESFSRGVKELGPHREGPCINCHLIAAEIREAVKEAVKDVHMERDNQQ